MKFHRIENPTFVEEAQLTMLYEAGVENVVLQFSKSSAYDGKILQRLNALCERFGAKLNIRFYGHYGSEFDCQNLKYLPAVRSLNLDCLMKAVHLEFIYRLRHLEEFAFGVFDADAPHLLADESFMSLRQLVLSETRRSNIDLAPLCNFHKLETLFINGHTRHIQSIATLPLLRKLSLSSIGKRASLGFIRSISQLKSLTYILGGRENVEDLAHEGLQQLEILRVLGLSNIDLNLFPNLERLRIEDQLRLTEIDIRPLRDLRRLSIFNCKNLVNILGIGGAQLLESLRIGITSVDLDTVLDEIPPSIGGLTLHSPRKAIDHKLQQRIALRGLPNAFYIDAP